MSGIGGSGISGYNSYASLSRIVEHLQSKGMNVTMNGQENLNMNDVSIRTVSNLSKTEPSFESFLKI